MKLRFLLGWGGVTGFVQAATFHVDKNGNDGQAGTKAQPFRTVQKAVAVAGPGDQVLVGAGEYGEEVVTMTGGAVDRRIVIDGQNAAILRRFEFRHSHITLKRLTISGYAERSGALVYLNRGAHFSRIENCMLDAASARKVYGIEWRSGTGRPFSDDAASDCVITATTIRKVLGITLISMAGDRNLVENCRLLDSGGADFFRLWGRNNVIRGNHCLNNHSVAGEGNHADFIQTFGNHGEGSQGHVIENNLVRGVEDGQLTQLSGNLMPEISDWTFRNNIFVDVQLGASCSVPGVKYFNNVFYRCNTVNGGHALNFGKRHYGGENEPPAVGGVPGYQYAHGAVVKNNVFLDCGAAGSGTKGWYSFENDLERVAADHNFVAKSGFRPVREDPQRRRIGQSEGWPQFYWYEPNGVNGGDPRFTDLDALNFIPQPDSPLIDRGAKLDGVRADFRGTARPQGPAPDIGAFEMVRAIGARSERKEVTAVALRASTKLDNESKYLRGSLDTTATFNQ
jgi:hypothetical protein